MKIAFSRQDSIPNHIRRGLYLVLAFVFFFSCQAKRAKVTIACAGDSLIRPTPAYLRRLLPSSRVEIKEWAQGGLSAVNYLSFFRRYPRWQREKVDFILLQLGTNDVLLFLRGEENEALFRHNLEAIIAEFKKLESNYFKHAQIILATVPFFYGLDNEAEENRVVSELINPSVIAVAEKEGVSVIDQAGCLRAFIEYYGPDGIHPSREGEKALARNWRRIVKNIWLRRQKRGGYF